MTLKVLVIEDDLDVASNIAEYLEARGVELDFAYDGETGLRLASRRRYAALVLDLMLPGIDGLTLCRRLRAQSPRPVPILMLTARDSLEDKVQGFEAGADDYLVKPFALPELYHRLLALQRRGTRTGEAVVRVGDLELDLASMTARRAGRPLRLNRTELKILATLLRAAPALVRRDELKAEVWGDEESASDDLVRVHIYRLRRVVDRPFGDALLRTVHGEGYRICEPESDEMPAGDPRSDDRS